MSTLARATYRSYGELVVESVRNETDDRVYNDIMWYNETCPSSEDNPEWNSGELVCVDGQFMTCGGCPILSREETTHMLQDRPPEPDLY